MPNNSNPNDPNAPIIDDGTTNNNPPIPADPTPAPIAAADDDPEFAGMSQRERMLVTKARGEEKRKLYKKMEEQEREIQRMADQIRQMQNAPAPTTPKGRETRDDQIERLFDAIQGLTESHKQTASRLEQMEQRDLARTRKSELRVYAQEQIAAIRQRGEDVIEPLVDGDTEEQIDAAIMIAHAEWMRVSQKEAAKYQQRQQPSPPASVTVQHGTRSNAGVPPVQVPNTVEADLNNETIADMTSNDAVRNGAYEKNRNALLGRLKRGYRYTGNQTSA